MYEALYNARGALSSPLRKDSYVMAVDTDLRAILAGLSGNHTYLSLTGGCGVEIVKVWGVDSKGIYITRGLDGTDILEFNEGDKVEYTLTVAEIEDRVPQQTLTLHRAGGIHIVGSEVRYKDITISVLGASEIIGEDWNIIIGRREDAYGCCDGNNDPDPVPVRPFYLTSHPYPHYEQDEITVSISVIAGYYYTGAYYPPPDENVQLSITVDDGTLRQILKTHDQQREEALGLSITVDDGTLRQILKTHNQQREEAMELSVEVTAGTLKVILITHTQYPEEAFELSIEVISGTLT